MAFGGLWDGLGFRFMVRFGAFWGFGGLGVFAVPFRAFGLWEGLPYRVFLGLLGALGRFREEG